MKKYKEIFCLHFCCFERKCNNGILLSFTVNNVFTVSVYVIDCFKNYSKSIRKMERNEAGIVVRIKSLLIAAGSQLIIDNMPVLLFLAI